MANSEAFFEWWRHRQGGTIFRRPMILLPNHPSTGSALCSEHLAEDDNLSVPLPRYRNNEVVAIMKSSHDSFFALRILYLRLGGTLAPLKLTMAAVTSRSVLVARLLLLGGCRSKLFSNIRRGNYADIATDGCVIGRSIGIDCVLRKANVLITCRQGVGIGTVRY